METHNNKKKEGKKERKFKAPKIRKQKKRIKERNKFDIILVCFENFQKKRP